MGSIISRRTFLLLCAGGLASLAMRPIYRLWDEPTGEDLVRVGTDAVSVYKRPDDKSLIVGQRFRDEVLNVYYPVESEYGPGYNPFWYRVWGGYVHAAHMQKVQVRLNPPLEQAPDPGQMAEVTVPFTEAYRVDKAGRVLSFIYGLYYQSIHWITGLLEGPDGEPWYRLKDELLRIDYIVPAAHLRPIPREEFAPISPDVPMEQKRIEVSIRRQYLTAYEGEKIVLDTKVATGMRQRGVPANGIPTDTPVGSFRIYSKMPSKHMGDGNITTDWASYRAAYELPGVPWVSFFAPHGVALHGTYWHDNFGVQMSHGCVNMRTEEARWIYRWTTPVAEEGEVERRGNGTLVVVS